MKPTRRKSKFAVQEDSDPLSVVVNLFDVAMVFAVALMVAMVMHMNMTEVFTQEDFTVVKNPGKENMEIIMKEGKRAVRLGVPVPRCQHGRREGSCPLRHLDRKSTRLNSSHSH